MGDSDDEMGVDRTLKVILVGDGASGKTSISSRMAQDNFNKQYRQTVGLDFFTKKIRLPSRINVTLQIWDIGGQSIGSPMLDKYLWGAHGALVVYDVTNAASFDNAEDWVNLVRKHTGEQEKPPHLALVGNKTDLEHLRVVRIEKHTKFAETHGMSSHYVSGKTGDSVRLLFRQVPPISPRGGTRIEVAADICGIQLSKTEIEQEIAVVKAEIGGEQRLAGDSKAQAPALPAPPPQSKSSICRIM